MHRNQFATARGSNLTDEPILKETDATSLRQFEYGDARYCEQFSDISDLHRKSSWAIL
jgi:hypothetical protein